MARKIIRSLPKRFDMKVTTIEEAQNVITIKFDELMDSLLTIEIIINDNFEKKNKSVAFKVDIEEDEDHVENYTNDNLTEYR